MLGTEENEITPARPAKWPAAPWGELPGNPLFPGGNRSFTDANPVSPRSKLNPSRANPISARPNRNSRRPNRPAAWAIPVEPAPNPKTRRPGRISGRKTRVSGDAAARISDRNQAIWASFCMKPAALALFDPHRAVAASRLSLVGAHRFIGEGRPRCGSLAPRDPRGAPGRGSRSGASIHPTGRTATLRSAPGGEGAARLPYPPRPGSTTRSQCAPGGAGAGDFGGVSALRAICPLGDCPAAGLASPPHAPSRQACPQRLHGKPRFRGRGPVRSPGGECRKTAIAARRHPGFEIRHVPV